MTVVLIAAVVVLALLGAPLFAVILAAALTGFWLADIPVVVIAVELYRIADTPLLLALPLFAYAGYLLAEGRSSQRLVAVTSALIGWMPAGLALVSFVACALFTAFTGASGVTIVALGALLYPALKQEGYEERFSLGLVTSSGSLGLLLVPSVPLIIYGVVAQQLETGTPFTLRELFLAGLMPAGLMLFALGAYGLWHVRGRGMTLTPFSGAALARALWAARWELPLPLFVLGGIYGGVFAVSEAAAVTALYVTVSQVLLYRDVSWRRLPGVMVDAMVMVGGILLILAAALAFTNVLVDAEIPQRLFALVSVWIESKLAFLLVLNITLLLLGAILDIFAALVIMVPLLLPVAVQYGIHPVHFGIVFLANMQIGYFTPPIGMNLFIASYRFRRPVTELYRASLPFMVVLLIALLVITYVPWLSLALL
ncbi:MAG TPA: TRAP transporter large permease subunit [Pseudomonadales bacterium]|nr:TRAP transporter large permease subunit [Pseudomonadales bacterium]